MITQPNMEHLDDAILRVADNELIVLAQRVCDRIGLDVDSDGEVVILALIDALHLGVKVGAVEVAAVVTEAGTPVTLNLEILPALDIDEDD